MATQDSRRGWASASNKARSAKRYNHGSGFRVSPKQQGPTRFAGSAPVAGFHYSPSPVSPKVNICALSYMAVSLNKGTPYRSQNTVIPIVRTPKKVPLILGNLHISGTDPQFLEISLLRARLNPKPWDSPPQ